MQLPCNNLLDLMFACAVVPFRKKKIYYTATSQTLMTELGSKKNSHDRVLAHHSTASYLLSWPHTSPTQLPFLSPTRPKHTASPERKKKDRVIPQDHNPNDVQESTQPGGNWVCGESSDENERKNSSFISVSIFLAKTGSGSEKNG